MSWKICQSIRSKSSRPCGDSNSKFNRSVKLSKAESAPVINLLPSPYGLMPEPQQERTAVTSKESKRTISQDSHENLRSQDNIIKSTAVESVDLAGRKVLAALQGHWPLKHWPPALASVLWQGCQIFQQKVFFFSISLFL